MNRPVPDEVILGLLKAQPAHGYELLECFRSHSHLGRIWTMSTSQLYSVLNRLSQQGAVAGRAYEGKNAPMRVEYEITELGEYRLSDWLYSAQPSASIHQIRVLFLSRIFIANLLDLPTEKIVTTQINACQALRDKFTEQSQANGSDIEVLALDFVVHQMNTAITWLTNSNFQFRKNV
jgi:DNA-binding PadR family transcriptional regulator